MKKITDYERNVFIELAALSDESCTFKEDYEKSTGVDRDIKEAMMNVIIAEKMLDDKSKILLASFRIAGITEKQAAQVFYIVSIKTK